MFQTKVVERRHTLCSTKFSKKNRGVYKIMWKIIVEADRSHMTIYGAKRCDLQ